MTIYAGYGRFQAMKAEVGRFVVGPKIELLAPKKRALAAQWLVEKRLARIRGRMEPDVFHRWCMSLDLILEPLVDLLGALDEK